MRFFERESCGKCTPCRIGTSAARQILDRLIGGAGTAADLDRLAEIGRSLRETSFCGLGKSACEPLRSALAHLRADFEQAVASPCN
jgi:NADH:ubiquinone oxidoreductase subunit F (NADH-binding)